MPTNDLISQRKLEHVNIALHKSVQFTQKTTGFEEMEVEYFALPEIDAEKIETNTTFLKHAFSFPFMVSSMTGGHEKTQKINQEIALACEEMGIGMGLGSTRAAIENKKLIPTYDVRKFAPHIFLACNIGVSNLKKYSSQQLQQLVNELQCDALIVHCNAAQEIVQKEGTTQFAHCLHEIARVARELEQPVIVKEVGNGLSPSVVKKLDKLPIAAIDVAGAGGTSWTAIESKRGSVDNKEFREKFWNVGIPTLPALFGAKKYSKKPIIASGGVRNGQHILKSLVAGAQLSAAALPIIAQQHQKGKNGITSHLRSMQREFKTAMFLCGARKVKELREKKYYLFGKTKEWVEQL